MDLNGNHFELYLMQNYAVLLQDWMSNKVIHCNKEMPEQSSVWKKRAVDKQCTMKSGM